MRISIHLLYLLFVTVSIFGQSVSDLQYQLAILDNQIKQLNNVLGIITVSPQKPSQEIVIPDELKNALSTEELQAYKAEPAILQALLTLNVPIEKIKSMVEKRLLTGAWPTLQEIYKAEEIPVTQPGTTPPPPPPPPPATAPTKKGLTAQQIANLTFEEKKMSDAYLMRIIKNLGRRKAGSFAALKKDVAAAFKILTGGAAQNAGFKFAADNAIDALINNITKWIDQHLTQQPVEHITQFLTGVSQNLLSKSIQNEFVAIVQNWFLTDIAPFRPAIITSAENIAVNLAAAQRKFLTADQENEASPDAKKASDKEFLNAFSMANNIDILIGNLNLLRINDRYLKYSRLQEDISAVLPAPETVAQTTGEVPRFVVGQEQIEAKLKELKKVTAEEQKKRTASPVAPARAPAQFTRGIIDELEMRKQNPKAINIESFTTQYLARYLFNPADFNNIKTHFVQKILKQPIIVKAVAQPFADYLDKVIAEALTYNEIIDFIIAVGDVMAQNKLLTESRIAWKQAGKTMYPNIRIEPDKLDKVKKFIQELITIINQKRFAPKALKDTLNAELIKGFKEVFVKDLSEQAQKQLNELILKPY